MSHFPDSKQEPSLPDAVLLQPIVNNNTSTTTDGRSTSSRASPARNANTTNPRQRRRPAPPPSQPSIRLRRLASSTNLRSDGGGNQPIATDFADVAHQEGNRRRSTSEPQRMQWDAPSGSKRDSAGSRPRGISSPMPQLDEDHAQEAADKFPNFDPSQGTANQFSGTMDGDVPHELARRPGLLSRASTAARSAVGMNPSNNKNTAERRRPTLSTQISEDEYENNLVDFLDVVDPEIATLSTLTNVQNSLFIPDLGPLFNRRPTYTFTRDPTIMREPESPADNSAEQTEYEDDNGEHPMIGRTVTISSKISETEDHYAVLPHGISLKGWSAAEKEELNDHVRHLLHSRRAAFKRSLKGFGQYVRRPLGFFVTLYAFLITGFGLLWVLFLIGWISVGGSRQEYVINIIDNVLVALFAVVGDGLIPFRIVDTYHMIYIAHYHHLTWRLRKENKLPDLKDHNDLPGLQPKLGQTAQTRPTSADVDLAIGKDPEMPLDEEDEEERVVLTPEQLKKLKHHQDKFSKSHTFYKPHETVTHHAFPLRLLVAVVVLLDFHSIFQVALGTCTWAIYYKVRPQALTTVILCCSLTCNITGGILISIGDKRTRKKDVVERMFRQRLTEEAIQKMEKRRKKEAERNEVLGEAEPVVPAGVTLDPERQAQHRHHGLHAHHAHRGGNEHTAGKAALDVAQPGMSSVT